MIHQVGAKLRGQISRFSGQLCLDMGKVEARFIAQMIFGLCSCGSVRLTEIGRALNEKIRLKATHKRLDRNLDDPYLESGVSRGILQLAGPQVGKDTLLLVDPSDIIKKYARKMENLAQVRDGSEGVTGNGYWFCPVVAAEVGGERITPLAMRLWSQKAAGFESENDEVLSIVWQVLSATDKRGIIVYDRGGDRGMLYREWAADAQIRFLIRQVGNRDLIYQKKRVNTARLVERCRMLYSEKIIKIRDGRESVYLISFGFLPVRLPEHSDRQLYLVVIKGFGAEPMLLLTTEPMRRERKTLWWAVEAYLTRWRVEDSLRFIKQSYDLEDIRLLTYRRLKNMMALVLAAAYFTATWLGEKTKLEILAMHVMEVSKRIFGVPDFKYYALAEGLKTIFKRLGQGLIETPHQLDDPQLLLRLEKMG